MPTVAATSTTTFVLPERAVARLLLGAVLVLNVANAAVLATGASHWLLLGLERNPSTWFSAAQLALAAVLAWAVGRERPDAGRWNLVAAVLLLLSVDEVATFHEKLGGLPVIPGIGNRAWAGAGLLLAAVVAWALLPWALRLESRLRFALVVGAVVYVTGAVGFEALASLREREDTVFWTVSTVEEDFELLGVYVVVRQLLAHLRATGRKLTVAIGAAG